MISDVHAAHSVTAPAGENQTTEAWRAQSFFRNLRVLCPTGTFGRAISVVIFRAGAIRYSSDYYQGDTPDSMVGVGAGVTLGAPAAGAPPRDVRNTKVRPTRMVLPLNPFIFFIEATLTPQRWAILARVSPLRTV